MADTVKTPFLSVKSSAQIPGGSMLYALPGDDSQVGIGYINQRDYFDVKVFDVKVVHEWARNVVNLCEAMDPELRGKS